MNLNYDEIDRKLTSLNDYLGSRYDEIGDGAYRNTFQIGGNPPKVLKCPNTNFSGDVKDNGIIANLVEYYISKKYAHLKIFPRTKLIWRNHIPLLIMERLDDETWDRDDAIEKFNDILEKNDIELWDGNHQSGLNSRGRWLCYDFGSEFDLVPKKTLAKIKRQAAKIYQQLSKIKVKKTK